MQETFTELDFCSQRNIILSSIFVLFRKKLFWPVIDVRHRETLKHWEKFLSNLKWEVLN